MTVDKIRVLVWNLHSRLKNKHAPTCLGIETSKACNRRCSYCPQSVAALKQEIISEDVWKLFLERLDEYGWNGRVALTHYGEPALVKDFSRYIRELKTARPGASPLIFTNGDKPEAIKRWLDAGAGRIIVTFHEPAASRTQDDEALVRRLRNAHPFRVRIRRLKPRTLWHHGGNVNVSIPAAERTCKAVDGLTVNIDGKVHLCCVDYFHMNCVGDIHANTIAEIWNSYADKRKIVKQGIPVSEMCKKCLGK